MIKINHEMELHIWSLSWFNGVDRDFTFNSYEINAHVSLGLNNGASSMDG